MDATTALSHIWQLGQLPEQGLLHAKLTGTEPALPSSFGVGTAAQVTVAAAALAACELGYARGQERQDVGVDMLHAATECTNWFSIDGVAPDPWDKFSGIYRCADGWVRVHANFAHHRDGALRLLGLTPGDNVTRGDAEAAMLAWKAEDFEQAAADNNLVAAAVRGFDQWDAHPQGHAIATQPLMTIERIAGGENAAPRKLHALQPEQRPLSGLRVLDLTRILAGPVCGRTLAAYGAGVMLVNSPNLPNIEAIADTSRGKLSAQVDLRSVLGQQAMGKLLDEANVFVQGYRPGALQSLGFGPEDVAARCPGIVYVSLSAYSEQGPWSQRRGFDSLVQSAMGFNLAEAHAAGVSDPKALPVQIVDCATGFLMAYGVSAALHRQMREGGSWHVRVSLAQTAQWIRGLDRVPGGFAAPKADPTPYLETSPSGFGKLTAIRHSAELSRTPSRWVRPSVPPGTDPPVWP